VVICPGGGYSNLSITKEGERIGEWLAEHGFVGMVLAYRLPHEGEIIDNVPLSQRDGLAGLRETRRLMDSLKVGEDKLVIMGFSAGGHLASSLVQLAEPGLRPNASVLVYPVISMREGIAHEGSKRKLLGTEPTDDLIAEYSTDENVTPDHPPTLLVHSTDDAVVPVENSLRYYEALREHGVPAALLIPERGGHGFGQRADLGWTEATMAWLVRQGF
jgi:acetyl esterase/lipase